jgi:hypothetical protein
MSSLSKVFSSAASASKFIKPAGFDMNPELSINPSDTKDVFP